MLITRGPLPEQKSENCRPALWRMPRRACTTYQGLWLPSLGLEPWRLCGSDHVVGEASHPLLGSVSSFCVLPAGPGGNGLRMLERPWAALPVVLMAGRSLDSHAH